MFRGLERRPRRGRLLVLVAFVSTVACGAVATPIPSSAIAPGGPAVAALSQAQGRLAPHVVEIRGARFSRVRAVMFGNLRGSKLRVLSPTRIRVTTPRMSAGTTVAVRVRTESGTSRVTGRSRYRFVGSPTVTSLSVRRGPLTGGTVVRIRGRDLDARPRVTFGGLPATEVRVVSGTALEVTSPVSYAQRAAVQVTTAYGASRQSAQTSFTFAEPAPVARGAVSGSAGTVTLAVGDVRTVAAVRDVGGLVTGWMISLGPGAPALATLDKLLLEPGATVYPAGLAGRVESVQVRPDGGWDVAVELLPLEEVLSSAEIEFAGTVGDLTGGIVESRSPRSMRSDAASVPSKVGFGEIKAGAIECTNDVGGPVEVSGKASLEFTELKPYLHFRDGGWFSDPKVDAWLSYERTATIEFSASQGAECKLRTAWQNSHKKVFIGPHGASFSFAPALEFSIGAKGTVKISQHSYQMTGFRSNPDGSIHRINASSADPVKFGTSGSVTAELYAGMEVQIGWLDRVGVGISAGLSASVEVEGDESQVCGSLKLELKATLYAYLDVWVEKWKLEAFEASLPLRELQRCWAPISFEGAPEIWTTEFDEVGVGQFVDEYLDTDDGRPGTWSVEVLPPSAGALPPGLEVEDSYISGFATTPGSYSFRLVFRDTIGHTVRAEVTMVVRTVAAFESDMLGRVNDLRGDWGCDPIALDPVLQRTARDHSADMAEKGYFETDSPDGRDPGDRMYDAGYDADHWSESIGKGYENPAQLYSGWVDYDKIFGYLVDCELVNGGLALVYSSDGVPYWTLDQAEPPFSGAAPHTKPVDGDGQSWLDGPGNQAAAASSNEGG